MGTYTMSDPKIQMAIYRIDKELFEQKQNKKIINTIINTTDAANRTSPHHASSPTDKSNKPSIK